METKKIARRLMTLLWVIISLVVLAGLVWGLYTVLANLFVYPMILMLNPNVSASIIAASATVLMATLSVLLSKYLEIRALVFKEHRDKKIPILRGPDQILFPRDVSVEKRQASLGIRDA